MTSKREQVLSALYTALKTLETPTLKIYRNLDKPQIIPAGGMVILRDGSEEAPEVLMSPLTYIYEHVATLEVMVQNADQPSRDAQLDTLLISIGAIISANRTLGGSAEWMEARAPEFTEEPVEGAPTMKLATVPVMIRYFTSDPLN